VNKYSICFNVNKDTAKKNKVSPMQKSKHLPAAKPRPGLPYEQRLQLTKKYMSNPNGPIGVRRETKLKRICLHCSSFGMPNNEQAPNDFQLWCEACTTLSFNDSAIKYNIWYTNHCSNHKCLAPIDSRDPEITECKCGGYICAECGSCKATCPYR